MLRVTEAQEWAVLSKQRALRSQPQHLLRVWANKSQMLEGEGHLPTACPDSSSHSGRLILEALPYANSSNLWFVVSPKLDATACVCLEA